jgi:hypothetical protein
MKYKFILFLSLFFVCEYSNAKNSIIPHPPIVVERSGEKAIMLFTPSPCENVEKKECISLYSLNLKNNKLNFVINLGEWEVISVFSANIPEKPMFVLSRIKADSPRVNGYYYRAIQFDVIESSDGVSIEFFPSEPQFDMFNYCFDGVNEKNENVVCPYKDATSIRVALKSAYKK